MKKYLLRQPAGSMSGLQYVDLQSGKKCLQKYYEYATRDDEIQLEHLAGFLRQMQRIENGPKVACEIAQSNMFGDHTTNTHQKYLNFLGAIIDSQAGGAHEFRAQIVNIVIPELFGTLSTDPSKYPYPGREAESVFMKNFCGFVLENNQWVRCANMEDQPLTRKAFSRLVEVPKIPKYQKWVFDKESAHRQADYAANSNFPFKKRKIRRSRTRTPPTQDQELDMDMKMPEFDIDQKNKPYAVGKCEACSDDLIKEFDLMRSKNTK